MDFENQWMFLQSSCKCQSHMFIRWNCVLAMLLWTESEAGHLKFVSQCKHVLLVINLKVIGNRFADSEMINTCGSYMRSLLCPVTELLRIICLEMWDLQLLKSCRSNLSSIANKWKHQLHSNLCLHAPRNKKTFIFCCLCSLRNPKVTIKSSDIGKDIKR